MGTSEVTLFLIHSLHFGESECARLPENHVILLLFFLLFSPSIPFPPLSLLSFPSSPSLNVSLSISVSFTLTPSIPPYSYLNPPPSISPLSPTLLVHNSLSRLGTNFPFPCLVLGLSSFPFGGIRGWDGKMAENRHGGGVWGLVSSCLAHPLQALRLALFLFSSWLVSLAGKRGLSNLGVLGHTQG